MEVDRNVYYCLLLFPLILSTLFLYLSITINVVETEKVSIDSYSIHGDLSYVVQLRNNSLYESKVLKNPPKIFPNITESITVLYSFSADCSNCSSVSGEYEVRGVIKTRDWNKTISIIPPKSFRGGYTLTVPVDLSEYYEIYERISRELGFKSGDATLMLQFTTHVRSEHFRATYSQPLTITLGSKVAQVTAQKLQKSKNIYRERELANTTNQILKHLLAILGILTALLTVFFYRKFEPKDVGEEEKLMRKYGDLIATGKRVESFDKIVELQSFDDLLKIAEFVNLPVIKIEKEFFVIHDNVAYVFRL